MDEMLDGISKVCSDTTDVLNDITKGGTNGSLSGKARVCSNMTEVLNNIANVYIRLDR